MKKLIVLLMAVLVTLIYVKKAPAPLVGGVAGKLINVETGLPIKGVKAWTNLGQHVYSDSNGVYTMMHPECYNADVTWEKQSYETIVDNFTIGQRDIIVRDWAMDYYGSKPNITEPDYNEWRPVGQRWEVTWRTAASSLGVRLISLELRGPSGCLNDTHLAWIGQDLANDGSHF